MPGNGTAQRNIKAERSIIFRSVMEQILVIFRQSGPPAGGLAISLFQGKERTVKSRLCTING
jgi:hypothetical protein